MKRQESRETKFQLLNIKLFSNYRQNEAGYFSLLKDLFDKKVMKKVGSTDYIILRTQFTGEWKNHQFIYGKISKFTKIENNDWLNIKDMSVDNFEIPPDRFPNLREVDYVYYPYSHRIAIISSSKLGIKSAYKYFSQALNEVITSNESYEVTIELSSNYMVKILNANEIRKIEINISPSNADINDSWVRQMDEDYKKGNAAKAKLTVVAAKDKSIDISKSKVINGMLGLAQSDGDASAVIINSQGQKEIIKTNDHPRVFHLKTKSQDIYKAIVENINKVFRSGRKK